MGYIVLRILVNALSIAILARFLPGFHVVDDSIMTFIVIGLVFGIINALVKPIITLLTCSLVVLTLGLFILVINGLMLWLTAALLPNLLQIDNFWWAILGGIIVSIINMIMESALGERGDKVEVKVFRS